MPSTATINAIAKFSEHQQGYVTRKQLLEAGISVATVSRLTAKGGILTRAGHGVYRMRGAPTCPFEDLYVCWLKLSLDVSVESVKEPRVLVSHYWAADIYPIGVFGPKAYEFTTNVRPIPDRRDIKIYYGEFGAKDWSWVYGMPVTRPARTVADLLARDEDLGDVGRLIFDALYRKKDYPEAIAKAAAPYAASYFHPELDGPGFMEYLLRDSEYFSTSKYPWIEEAREGINGPTFDPPFFIHRN